MKARLGNVLLGWDAAGTTKGETKFVGSLESVRILKVVERGDVESTDKRHPAYPHRRVLVSLGPVSVLDRQKTGEMGSRRAARARDKGDRHAAERRERRTAS